MLHSLCTQPPSEKRCAKRGEGRSPETLNDVEGGRRHRQIVPIDRSICGRQRGKADNALTYAPYEERRC